MGVNRSFHRFNLFFSPSVSNKPLEGLPSSKTNRGTEHCVVLIGVGRAATWWKSHCAFARAGSPQTKRPPIRPGGRCASSGNLPTLLSEQPFSGRRQSVPNNRPLLFPRNRDLPPFR